MTLFLLLATLMVVLGLCILGPLLRAKPIDAPGDHRDMNIAIARDQQAKLIRALEDGEIDQRSYARRIAELEQTLATDFASESPAQVAEFRGRWSAIVLVMVFVPTTAVLLYQRLGTPQALDPAFVARTQRAANPAADAQAPDLAELIPRLEARLAEQPDDLQGWLLLGRTRLMSGDFGAAIKALRRAAEIDANNPTTLATLAEAIAMSTGGALAGEPIELLDRALALDATHPASRWLRGVAHQQAGEHRRALAFFQGLKADVEGDSAAAASVDEMIARSQKAIGANAPAEANNDAAGATANNPASSKTTDSATAQLTVSITLGDEAADAVDGNQAVFVYARAADGPPMPLAVVRRSVADLPLVVTLDETKAVVPQLTLASFAEVAVGARVSTSGDAVAASGDWYGEVSPVRLAEQSDVAVIIDQRVP